MEHFVDIQGLSFQRNDRFIFHDINMMIPEGKVTAIMGPSGSGKTTLLRLIGKQLEPSKGSITVAGKPLSTLNHDALYQLRKKMGMLFQTGGLFTHLDVFENVAFPLREHTTLSESMIHTLVLLKLEMVGLRSAGHLMPAELSGGMARRVSLARAIALDPDLILYDEPLTGQDPISMGVLLKLIRTLNDALGLTSIIVSHDVKEVLDIADLVYIIADTRIIAEGTPAILKQNNNPMLRQFMDGLPDGPVPFHYPGCSLMDDLMKEEA